MDFDLVAFFKRFGVEGFGADGLGTTRNMTDKN